jgi:hypothetical protein
MPLTPHRRLCLGPSTAITQKTLPRGLYDEDITNMDTPTVVTYNSKVKLFFSIIIFNTCDEWTLHHDMCSMSFTKVLTWIKECVDHAWKGWIIKHLDWGPNPSAPYCGIRKQGDQV